MKKQLYRNEQNKVIAGVCAGLSDYFNVDVSWIRIAFLLAFFAGCSGGLIYVIIWIVVPPKSLGDILTEKAADFISPLAATERKEDKFKRGKGPTVFGGLLIVIGVYFLLSEFDILPEWLDFGKLWPLAIIIPGIFLIAKANKTRECVNNDNDCCKPPTQGETSIE